MQQYSFHKGTTSQLIEVFIQDATATDGAGLTGLVYNSAGLSAYYRRRGSAGGGVVISLVNATLGTWTSGGFKEIDATNLPGWYEIGLPNALLASGALSGILSLKGAVNMVPINAIIDLDALDTVKLGATGLDAMLTDLANDAAARASGFGMLRWLFNRFANQRTQNSTQQKVYNDAGSLISTMATSSDGTTVTVGKSS
jgi:hypothetical protein